MSEKREITVGVLGGGIVGICCALSLREAGAEVCLIEAGEPGQGASRGNAGVVSPWSVVPQSTPGLWKHIPGWLLREDGPVSVRPGYFPKLVPWGMRFLGQGRKKTVRRISTAMKAMNESNVDKYKKRLGDIGQGSLIQDSYYVHGFRANDGADLQALNYQVLLGHGADLERVDGAALRALEPALAEDFRSAVLVKGQGRILSPGRVGEVLTERFLALGGIIKRGKVLGLTPDNTKTGQWNIQTDDGNVFMDKVVVSMGAWSGKLLSSLGVRVALETERGYHVEFPNPPVSLTHSVMDTELKLVASSMNDGLRVAGTAEFAGLDYPLSQKRLDSLIGRARRMIPALQDIEPNVWMGSRPSMPDSLPCIGEVKGHNGLFAAFGHGHFGLMMAPKTAEIISDLVFDRSPNIDLTPYRLDRF